MRSLSDDHILTDRQQAISLQDANTNPLQFVDIRPAPVRSYAKARINWLRFTFKLLKIAVGLSIIVGAMFLALAFIVVNWN